MAYSPLPFHYCLGCEPLHSFTWEGHSFFCMPFFYPVAACGLVSGRDLLCLCRAGT